MRPGRRGSARCLWNVLKRRSFPVLGFCGRRKLRLGEAKTAPKEENPNPKDRRKAIGCILAWCRVPKAKSRLPSVARSTSYAGRGDGAFIAPDDSGGRRD